MKNKTCPKCELEKELGEFAKNKTCKDGLQRICKYCVAKQSKKSYNKNPQKYKERILKQNIKSVELVDNFKKQNPCAKCGETRIWVLDFHHIEGSNKESNIGNLRGSGCIIQIKNEINKCIILCKNCHYDFHYLEKINNINLENYLDL
jgi:hypothetical protein